MSRPFEARRDRLASILRREAIDALLVTDPTNVAYLTGFGGDSSWLIVGLDRTVLVSDFRYREQIGRECPGLDVAFRTVSETTVRNAVATRLGLLGHRRVGVEAENLSLNDFEGLRAALPSRSWKHVSWAVEGLRAIKDEDEVRAIRGAVRAAERAFQAVLAGLRPEDSEKDVADAIECALRRAGAEGAAFPTIAAVGANAALPHHHPSQEVRVADAPYLLIDWGAARGHPACGPRPYRSDLTRMVATGKVTAEFETVHRAVAAAQERAIAAIHPGARASDVDAAAREVLHQADLGRYFGHGLGHGVGLDIHEDPRLRPGCETVLEAGMVVTVEPGAYLPGRCGVRIEDLVLITPDGPEILTSLPRSFAPIEM
jgi:Xaa-Pro aminopeptidase